MRRPARPPQTPNNASQSELFGKTRTRRWLLRGYHVDTPLDDEAGLLWLREYVESQAIVASERSESVLVQTKAVQSAGWSPRGNDLGPYCYLKEGTCPRTYWVSVLWREPARSCLEVGFLTPVMLVIFAARHKSGISKLASKVLARQSKAPCGPVERLKTEGNHPSIHHEACFDMRSYCECLDSPYCGRS